MKKLFFLIVAILCFVDVNAQTRTDSNGDTVHHHFFVVAEYQMRDFEFAKESGCYGLGLVFNSISHWGIFHVGANVNFSINTGFVDDTSCIADFGPSVRLDLNRNFFVNIPVNAICEAITPEGSTEMETSWGAKIAPSLHAFLSDRFGLYVGPQVQFGSDATSFGMQAGLSYSF